MHSSNYIDLIEDYLDDLLDKERRRDFEKQLKSNQSLQESLELSRNIRKGFKNNDLLEVKDKILRVQESLEMGGFFDAKVKGMNRNNSGIWKIAATILLIASAFYLFYESFSSKDIESDKLRIALNKVDPEIEMNIANLNSFGFANSNTGLLDSLVFAMAEMKKGNYIEARPILADLVERYPDNTEATYYAALNQLYIGNYKISVELFSKIQNITGDLKYKSQYYYATSLWGLDKSGEMAYKVFSIIAEDIESPYRKIANENMRLIK